MNIEKRNFGPKTVDDHSQLQVFGLAAIGLLVIQLSLFAISWPFSGTSADDWSYLYMSQLTTTNNDWFITINNRQFTRLSITLSQVLFPGQFQGLYYIHLLSIYAVSVGLFHSFRRLFPGHSWFGFVFSAIYLAYIPTNPDHSTYRLVTYSWVLLLAVLAMVMAIEHAYWRGKRSWAALGLATCAAYLAARGLELITPFLFVAIPSIWIYLSRRLTRKIMISVAVWGIVLGIAGAQFVIPYSRNDESVWYQSRYQSAGLNLPQLAKSTIEYHRIAFPSPQFLSETQFDYPPAILSALMVGIISVLYWRRFPSECKIPPGVVLLVFGLLGLAWVTLTGAGYIYTQFFEETRNQFFSAPGHALLLASILGMIGLAGSQFLQVKPAHTLGVLLAVYFVIGGQWFYRYDRYWDDPQSVRISFDQHVDVYNDLVALLPNVADNTLILMTECQVWGTTPIPTFAAFTNLQQRVYATRYLYGMVRNRGVQLANLEMQNFDLDGLNFTDGFLWDQDRVQYYGFEQMIVLRCVDDYLEIMDYFPRGYTHPDARISNYNPYARIEGGFVPEDNQRMLAR